MFAISAPAPKGKIPVVSSDNAAASNNGTPQSDPAATLKENLSSVLTDTAPLMVPVSAPVVSNALPSVPEPLAETVPFISSEGPAIVSITTLVSNDTPVPYTTPYIVSGSDVPATEAVPAESALVVSGGIPAALNEALSTASDGVPQVVSSEDAAPINLIETHVYEESASPILHESAPIISSEDAPPINFVETHVYEESAPAMMHESAPVITAPVTAEPEAMPEPVHAAVPELVVMREVVTVPDPASHLPGNLAQVEAEHRRWLASEGKEGKRANLRGQDFSHTDLTGVCFMEASLRGAILTGANLSGADLRAADLADANLVDANLSSAKLSGATFSRVQMHRAHAEGADLTTANLTGVIAEGINLTDAKLTGAILRDANFRQANFTHATLRDANMRGVTAVGANMGAVDLTSADCRDVNFDHARFTGAVLKGTNFRGATLGNVDLNAADFSVALDVAAEVVNQPTPAVQYQEEQAQLATLRAQMEAQEQAIGARAQALGAREQALEAREQALVLREQTVEGRERTIAPEREKLKAEMEHFTRMKAVQVDYDQELAGSSKAFVVCAALWGMYAVGIIWLTANAAAQLQHMKTERVLFIVGIALFAMALSFFSMVRSLRITGLIKKVIALSPQHTETSVGDTHQPATIAHAVADAHAHGHNHIHDAGGHGFGKKK